SMRNPVNCCGRMLPRSEPEPFTHKTRVGRSRKSSSVALLEVLPPPQLATERSEPSRFDRYASASSVFSPAAWSASHRFHRGVMEYLIVNPPRPHPPASPRGAVHCPSPDTPRTDRAASQPRLELARAAAARPCHTRL